MSNQPNFGALLDAPSETVKRPPALPKGTYLLLVTKFEPTQSSQKKTDGIRYFFQPIQAGSDVDQTRLAGIDLNKKELREDFWVTPDALYRLTEFHASILGPTPGVSVRQNLPAVVGQQVFGYVDEVPSNKPGAKPEDVFNNITAFTSVNAAPGAAA